MMMTTTKKNKSPLFSFFCIKLYVDDFTLIKQENNAPYEFNIDTTKYSVMAATHIESSSQRQFRQPNYQNCKCGIQ